MTAQTIIQKIKEIGLNQFARNGFKDDDLPSSDVVLSETDDTSDSYGNTSYQYTKVIHFPGENVYIMMKGSYSSYNDDDWYNVCEVFPKHVNKIVYQTQKD